MTEEATHSQPKDIKRVSKETVHKICSSQVILNLAIAVKELVENSVDAGSKTIEVKIKDYGSDGFEVSDNGWGIEQENFEGVTAKNYTSKLKIFDDLESIKTFGFRGEALSSLCALSDVTITTRHASVSYGSKLTFDHEGKIIEKKIVARNVGTTVSVSDLFKTLPVRKSEFQKNHRKDFGKMVQLLQEYCLVLIGVKIICTNQTRNGSRTTVLNTQGVSVMENIISIFGPKQSQELIKFNSATNEEGSYTQESIVDPDDPNSILDIKEKEVDNLNKGKFKLEGFISNIEHSSGRNVKDRQFFYVNSRPVEIKPIVKIVNDVYHRYHAKSFPFVYLNLLMDQSKVDINLSKDKRQVAICEDKILMYVVKRSLLNTYGALPSKLKFISVNNVVKELNKSSDDEENEEDKILIVKPSSNFGKSLRQWKLTPEDPTPKQHSPAKRKLEQTLSPVNVTVQVNKTRRIDAYFDKASTIDVDEVNEIENQDENQSLNTSIQSQDDEKSISCKTMTMPNTLKFEMKTPAKAVDPVTVDISKVMKDIANESGYNFDSNMIETMEKEFIEDSYAASEKDNNSSDEVIEVDVSRTRNPFKHVLNLSIDKIAADSVAEEQLQERMNEQAKIKSYRIKFKEKIDPSKNKKAEVELETEIKKDMFSQMEVLGQFNLGFIIAKLESDLFIVDQHASDERYNFETLQKSLKIESQKMISPEKLELTAIQEDVIIENLKVFEMNGFKFDIDEHGEATKRIKLTSRPYSKNYEFGKEDIEELIFILQESPMAVVRPSRIRTMLASRACRKSVMIGDSLTKNQMKKLLTHMGEIDHCWQCPHGRPTIRFLQNLDFIDDQK